MGESITIPRAHRSGDLKVWTNGRDGILGPDSHNHKMQVHFDDVRFIPLDDVVFVGLRLDGASGYVMGDYIEPHIARRLDVFLSHHVDGYLAD